MTTTPSTTPSPDRPVRPAADEAAPHAPTRDSSFAVDAGLARGVQVGEGNVQHNYFGGRAPVSWPHRVGVVPALAGGYQTREVGVEVDRVAGGGTAVLTQVLSGLGGVGKTQLAAAFAHRAWTGRAVDLLVWITAVSRQAIVAGYAQAAIDVSGLDDADAEQAAGRFLAWLAATGNAALYQHTGDALLTPTAHEVLFRIGQSLGDTGQVSTAVAHFTQLRADCQRVLGPDHPDTLTARSHLTWWQREAGDPAGAAQAAQRLLVDRLRILGPDHPDTLTTRNTLAYCRGEAGDAAGAATAFAELLTDRSRVLGPDHFDALHILDESAHSDRRISATRLRAARRAGRKAPARAMARPVNPSG